MIFVVTLQDGKRRNWVTKTFHSTETSSSNCKGKHSWLNFHLLSLQILRDAQTLAERMYHRGACACDNDTGDGAGVLTAIPHQLYAKELWVLFCLRTFSVSISMIILSRLSNLLLSTMIYGFLTIASILVLKLGKQCFEKKKDNSCCWWKIISIIWRAGLHLRAFSVLLSGPLIEAAQVLFSRHSDLFWQVLLSKCCNEHS